jgi:hypothetical protein
MTFGSDRPTAAARKFHGKFHGAVIRQTGSLRNCRMTCTGNSGVTDNMRSSTESGERSLYGHPADRFNPAGIENCG